MGILEIKNNLKEVRSAIADKVKEILNENDGVIHFTDEEIDDLRSYTEYHIVEMGLSDDIMGGIYLKIPNKYNNICTMAFEVINTDYKWNLLTFLEERF